MHRFKKRNKYDFLPSNLEIIEKPPTPLGAAIIYIITLMLITLFILSYTCKVDDIVTTRGTLEMKNGILNVNTNQSSKIKKINKRTGDRVKKEDVLIELEDNSAAVIKELKKTISLERLKQSMSKTEIDGIRKDDIFLKQKDLDENDINEMKLEYDLYWKGVSANEKAYQKQLHGVNEEMKKPNLSPDELKHLQSSKKDIEDTYQQSKDEKKLSILKDHNNEEKQLRDNQNQLKIAERSSSEKFIRAPADGTILSTNYNTIGTYVNTATNIAEIVPDDDIYIIVTKIPNQYIAKVHKGQEVTIKVDAYDYQIYGGMIGKVKDISPTTKLNEQKTALEYEATIEIIRNDKNLELMTGMSVALNIKTRRQKIIDYILEPVRKTVDDAF